MLRLESFSLLSVKTLQDRLREVANDLGIPSPNGRFFEELLGLSSGRISQIFEPGSNGKLGQQAIRRLVAKGYNPDWVQEGKGKKRLRGGNVEPGPDMRGSVPVISWVQAGNWSEIMDTFAAGEAEEWLPCPIPHGERTFVLRVRGESMHNPHGRPSFMDGDLIFVDPDRQVENGSMVVVRLDAETEATFKKLVIEGERKYLRALNPNWPEPVIQVNGEATICGVVIFKGERI